jgi:hypothetical protein
MKFKKKLNIKKRNDNQRKSKTKKEERKKKIEKKIIKKPKNIKKSEKKIIKNPKNEEFKKEKNKDREINFEKIASFPYEFYFYKDLIKENLGLCSTFITFKSIKDTLTLVYVTDDYSIIS